MNCLFCLKSFGKPNYSFASFKCEKCQVVYFTDAFNMSLITCVSYLKNSEYEVDFYPLLKEMVFFLIEKTMGWYFVCPK